MAQASLDDVLFETLSWVEEHRRDLELVDETTLARLQRGLGNRDLAALIEVLVAGIAARLGTRDPELASALSLLQRRFEALEPAQPVAVDDPSPARVGEDPTLVSQENLDAVPALGDEPAEDLEPAERTYRPGVANPDGHEPEQLLDEVPPGKDAPPLQPFADAQGPGVELADQAARSPAPAELYAVQDWRDEELDTDLDASALSESAADPEIHRIDLDAATEPADPQLEEPPECTALFEEPRIGPADASLHDEEPLEEESLGEEPEAAEFGEAATLDAGSPDSGWIDGGEWLEPEAERVSDPVPDPAPAVAAETDPLSSTGPAVAEAAVIPDTAFLPTPTLETPLQLGAPDDLLEGDADDRAQALLQGFDSPGRALPAQTAAEESSSQAPARLPAHRSSGQGTGAGSLPSRIGRQLIAQLGSGAPLPQWLYPLLAPSARPVAGSLHLHTDRDAGHAARVLQARAFTLGRDIFFAPGAFAPGTREGRRLLAHELGHVAQPYASRWTTVRRDPDDEAAPAAPDDLRLDLGIEPKAVRRNKHWWERLQLRGPTPVRRLDPNRQPYAYANRTLAIQRLIRNQGLDVKIGGKKIETDGILGPSTYIILRVIAVKTKYASARLELESVGADMKTIGNRGGEAWKRSAVERTEEVVLQSTPQSISVSADKLIDSYQARQTTIQARQTTISLEDRQKLDSYLFGAEGAPEEATSADRVAILKVLLGGSSLTGIQGWALTRERHFLHEFDVQAMVAKDPNYPRLLYFFLILDYIKNADDRWRSLEDAKADLGLPPLPDEAEQRTLMERVQAQNKALTPEERERWGNLNNTRAGLLVALYLPKLAQHRIDAAVSAHFAEKERKEAERIARNREESESAARALIALLNQEIPSEWEERFKWEWRVAHLIGQFDLAYSATHHKAFETLLDYLATREGGKYFTRFFDEWSKARNWERRVLVVTLVERTKYKRDSRYLAFLSNHRAIADKYRHHDYDFTNKVIYLDRKRNKRLVAWKSDLYSAGKTYSVAGNVSGIYYRDEDIKRMVPARQEQLIALARKIAGARIAKLVREGVKEEAFPTPDKFGEEVLKDALAAMKPPFDKENDIEEIEWRFSLKVIDLEKRMVDGITRAYVDSVLVEAVGDGDWKEVPGSRRWRTEAEFEETLFWYRYSQIADIIEIAALAVMLFTLAFVLWASGGAAFLISLAGGGTALGISMSISLFIYLITAKKYTLNGFLIVAVDGYLGAAGFRLFKGVGAGLAKKLADRPVRAWVLQTLLRGSLAGGFEGLAGQFARDLIRIVADGEGSLSSWQAYLTRAGLGAALGSVFELGGSALLSGLFKAAGPGVLNKASQVFDVLSKNRISPARFTTELTASLSRWYSWLRTQLEHPAQAAVGFKLFKDAFADAAADYTKKFAKDFGEGLRETIHRDLLELAGAKLGRESVAGLSRLLKSAELPDEAIVKLLAKLKTTHADNADAFLRLLGAFDDDAFKALAKDVPKLNGLADKKHLLGLVAPVGEAEVRFLLKQAFGEAADKMDDWAARLANLEGARKGARAEVLRVMREHGAYVTPDAVLAMARSIKQLDDQVVGGVRRLLARTRSSTDVEAFLKAAPVDGGRLELYLRHLAREKPGKDLDQLLAIAADPKLGARLLQHTDQSYQLIGLAHAMDGKLGQLDKILQVLRPIEEGWPRTLSDAEAVGLISLLKALKGSESDTAVDALLAPLKTGTAAHSGRLLRFVGGIDAQVLAGVVKAGQLKHLTGAANLLDLAGQKGIARLGRILKEQFRHNAQALELFATRIKDFPDKIDDILRALETVEGKYLTDLTRLRKTYEQGDWIGLIDKARTAYGTVKSPKLNVDDYVGLYLFRGKEYSGGRWRNRPGSPGGDKLSAADRFVKSKKDTSAGIAADMTKHGISTPAVLTAAINKAGLQGDDLGLILKFAKWVDLIGTHTGSPPFRGGRKNLAVTLDEAIGLLQGAGYSEYRYGQFRRKMREAVLDRVIEGTTRRNTPKAQLKILKEFLDDPLIDSGTKGALFAAYNKARLVAGRKASEGVALVTRVTKPGTALSVAPKARMVRKPGMTRERDIDGVLDVNPGLGPGAPPAGGRFAVDFKAGPGAFRSGQAKDYSTALKAGSGKLEMADGQVYDGLVYLASNKSEAEHAVKQLKGLNGHSNMYVGYYDEATGWIKWEPR